MADTTISWTPIGGGGTGSLILSQRFRITRWRGWQETDRRTTFTVGGSAVSVVNDSWFEFEIRCESYDAYGGVDTNMDTVSGFLGHFSNGGEFRIERDAVNGDTATTAAHTAGGNQFSVSAGGVFAAGDMIYVESGANPLIWQQFILNSKTPSLLTVNGQSDYDFPSGSPVRSQKILPKCVGLKPYRFSERDAGKGVGYDLEFSFRTVR